MILNNNNIYTDLIIPLGSLCITADFLRENNLRKFATPFDWMDTTNMNLQSFIYYFKDFTNFLKNKKVIGIKTDAIETNIYRFYSNPQLQRQLNIIDDINTGLRCIHYFPVKNDIDEYYNNVFYPKMKKRFDRLLRYIDQSNDILFISFLRNDHIKKILSFLKEFNNLFNKNYTYVLVNNTSLYREQKFSYEFGKYKIYNIKANFIYNNYWNSQYSVLLRQKNLKRLANRIIISNKINLELDVY